MPFTHLFYQKLKSKANRPGKKAEEKKKQGRAEKTLNRGRTRTSLLLYLATALPFFLHHSSFVVHH